MPKTKNQGKNKSRFEVRGGVPNEFEFAQHEGEMTEAEQDRFIPQGDQSGFPEAAGESPQERAERVKRLMAEASGEAERRLRLPKSPTVSGVHPARARQASKKSGRKSGQGSDRKFAAGAKKAAGAKTGAVRKSGATKGAVKKVAAKKAAKKQGATKKAAAKKSAAKKGARRQ